MFKFLATVLKTHISRGFMKIYLMIAAVCCLSLAAQLRAETSSAGVPAGYELVYEQTFSDPTAIQEFTFSDPDAWRLARYRKDAADVPGGWRGSGSLPNIALEQHQESDYRGPHRSPFNIALIEDLLVGSFVLEADLLQTGREYGHRDMCVFFNFQDPAHFYYVHMAAQTDPHAHNIFIVDDAPRTKISDTTTEGIEWGQKEWHRVRVKRDAERGTIKVYFDDMSEPIMTAQDEHFRQGHMGFGTFDDTGMIDNIRVWAPEAKEERVKAFE